MDNHKHIKKFGFAIAKESSAIRCESNSVYSQMANPFGEVWFLMGQYYQRKMKKKKRRINNNSTEKVKQADEPEEEEAEEEEQQQ